MLSHHFLKYGVLAIQKWNQQIRTKAVLENIRDDFIKGDSRDTYPLGLENIDKHQVGDDFDAKDKSVKYQREKYLAHISILMVSECDEVGDGAEVVVDAGAQQKFAQQLEQTVPALPDATVKWPMFVFKDKYKECQRERYNRAHNFLRYFRYLAGSEE